MDVVVLGRAGPRGFPVRRDRRDEDVAAVARDPERVGDMPRDERTEVDNGVERPAVESAEVAVPVAMDVLRVRPHLLGTAPVEDRDVVALLERHARERPAREPSSTDRADPHRRTLTQAKLPTRG